MIQESDASVPANEPHNANCSLLEIAGRKLDLLLNQDFAGDAHDDDDDQGLFVDVC